jgi:hypothetical protein
MLAAAMRQQGRCIHHPMYHHHQQQQHIPQQHELCCLFRFFCRQANLCSAFCCGHARVANRHSSGSPAALRAWTTEQWLVRDE